MQTMERLGLDGWAALNLAAHVFEASGVASSGDEKQNR